MAFCLTQKIEELIAQIRHKNVLRTKRNRSYLCSLFTVKLENINVFWWKLHHISTNPFSRPSLPCMRDMKKTSDYPAWHILVHGLLSTSMRPWFLHQPLDRPSFPLSTWNLRKRLRKI